MTAIPQAQLTPAARLNAAGLAVAAAGIVIQYLSGEDFPTIPPGLIILLAAAAVVAFGPWRRAPVAGLVAAAGSFSDRIGPESLLQLRERAFRLSTNIARDLGSASAGYGK